MIEVKVWDDPVTGNKHFEGVVTMRDLREIQLDPLDRAVIDSPSVTAADIFQDLEILARRQQEQSRPEEQR